MTSALARVALAAALAACPGPTAERTPPAPADPAGGSAVVQAPPAAPIDAPVATQDELLAAIQKAMNELDEAVQLCWAAAAAERFDVEGEIVATIDIAPGTAGVSIARDSARNPTLAACVSELLAKYAWPPPLHGQAIQLPFKFSAPDGQNVIDRSLVPWKTQAKTGVAVLLDENNTGNDAASMLEVAIAGGGTTGKRVVDRAELWYFLGAATAMGRPVGAGDMMYVPKGGTREVAAAADAHAIIVLAPGGREGTARAGALPARDATQSAGRGATVLPAAKAKTYRLPTGRVTIYAEPAIINDKGVAASVIDLAAGTQIAEHVHAKETELLYVLSGSGTMTIKGVSIAVSPTSVVQIPAATKHAFTATSAVRALQIYAPAGPEQRFKAKP